MSNSPAYRDTTLPLSVNIRNIGPMDAEEVVQVYLSDLEASAPVPLNKLVGFQRSKLQAGKERSLKFVLSPESMMYADENGEYCLESGRFRLTVGSCSPGKRAESLGVPVAQVAYFDLVSPKQG